MGSSNVSNEEKALYTAQVNAINAMAAQGSQYFEAYKEYMTKAAADEADAKAKLAEVAGKQQMLDLAVANQNKLATQATNTVSEARNQLSSELDSLMKSTYGTSAEDFFQRGINAAQSQGQQMGMSAGNLAQQQAQQSARQAGLSKSAAAAMGAGASTEAAQNAYLQGFGTGQQTFATGAQAMNSAGQQAAQSKFGAAESLSNQLMSQGATEVSGAGTGMQAAQQMYQNAFDRNKLSLDTANEMAKNTNIALGNEGGRVTAAGIINVDRLRDKPKKKKKGGVINIGDK